MKKQITTMMAILLLIGCASAPKRLMVPASDEYTLYARGLSTHIRLEAKADADATLQARNALVAAIESRVKSLTKSAYEQIGIGKDAELNSQFSQVIKSIVNETINISVEHAVAETRLDKKTGAFRAEVVYKVNIGPINKSIMENIKKRQNLYERFRTTELFNELEKEIEKEESK